jgi:hypothetical protein
MVGLTHRLYMHDTFRLDGEPGQLVICVVKGVHEGSCLSPTLFIFFIRELPNRLNRLTTNCPVIGGLSVSCMFFADDLTLINGQVSSTVKFAILIRSTVKCVGLREFGFSCVVQLPNLSTVTASCIQKTHVP